jgi:hypothetical protein
MQPTKIVMNTVYRLLTKSNSYTVHKKIGLNFFAARGGEQTITFFELCNHYFLLIVYKLYPTTVFMIIFVGCTVKKSNGMLTSSCRKNLNIFFVNCVTITFC